MSSQNNENANAATGTAIVAAGLYILALLLFFLLAILVFVFTVLAIWAWHEPRTIGRTTIMPEEARSFVYWGLIGAGVAPLLVVMMAAALGERFDPDILIHSPWVGYVLGATLQSYIAHQEQEGRKNAAEEAEGVQPAPRAIAPLPPSSEPFRYASWDDEEVR